MSTITAKIQIFPKEDEKTLLKQTIRAYSSACSFVSTSIFLTKELKQKALHNPLYTKIKNQFKLGSQMACSVLISTIARYKSAKSNGHDWSKLEFKRPELDLVWNRDYSLMQNKFSVNILNGRIKVSYKSKAMEKYFDGSWQFGTAKLVNRLGKWFLHIPMTKAREQLQNSIPKRDSLCFRKFVWSAPSN